MPNTGSNDPTASITFTDAETGESYVTTVSNGTAIWTPQTQATGSPLAVLWATGSLHQITASFSDSLVYSTGESYPANVDGTTVLNSPTVTILNNGLGSQVLAAGMNVTGPGIPAGTTIASVGSGTITLSADATASLTDVPLSVDPVYALTGTTTRSQTQVTGLLNTSALAVGMSVSGVGIPAGDSIASIAADGTTITLAVAATANSGGTPTLLSFGPVWAGDAGEHGEFDAVIQNLPSTNQLAAGMAVTGAGIPSGTFIASVTGATSITLTQQATATADDVDLVFAQVVQKQNVTLSPVFQSVTPIYGRPE